MDEIKKYLPLNFSLLMNPINWVIVFLMVALAGVALALILKPSAPINPSEIVKD